jgi:hypothetical protein
MELTNEQIKSLALFALDVLDDFPDIVNLDGGDLQDIAERHKILVPQIVHAPCHDDGCGCAEMCTDDEFTAGVTCYHIADWLDRVDELRNEAVDAGQKSPMCNPNQHVWKEEYYGYKCEGCQMFIPYGSEPWLPVVE